MEIRNYKTILEDVEVYKDKDGDCFLSLKYNVENTDGSVDQFVFPSVLLPISDHSFSISNDYVFGAMTINCGFGDLPIIKGNVKLPNGKTAKDVFFTKQQIKEAPAKEMTLDEIEKQLGYPVKIVAEKKSETKKKRVI